MVTGREDCLTVNVTTPYGPRANRLLPVMVWLHGGSGMGSTGGGGAFATGSGGASRRILGTVVITGMLAATAIAIFIIPMLFVIMERLAHRLTPQADAGSASAPLEGRA